MKTIPQSSGLHGSICAVAFLLLGLLQLVLLSAVNKKMLLATVYDPSFLKLPATIETLLTGASDIQFGANPDFIPYAINVARPAENFFYAYYKLRFILTGSNQLKNVILGFNPADFCSARERDLYRSEFHNLYFMLLDRNGYRITFRPNKDWFYLYAKYSWGLPIELYKEIRILLAGLLKRISPHDYPFCGGFLKHEGSKELLVDVYYANAFLNGTKDISPSSAIMIEYLKKIAILCKDKNITLYLVIPPLHPSFISILPSYYEELTVEILHDLRNINPNIHFYDYRHSGFSNDCFFDAVHLNAKGAALFSQKIHELLINKKGKSSY